MGHEVEQDLITVAREWDRAMVQNDAEDIGRYMADDWTIVASDGSITDRARFLDLVRSGILSHDVMESDDFRVRVYGDAAVLLARSISGGAYQGVPFREREQTSNVFIKQQGQWRCVLTHLSRLVGPSSEVGGAG